MWNETDFGTHFVKLTGQPRHFPWQWRLYQKLAQGSAEALPTTCALPTGLGKTSVVALWLLALASGARRLPRRLVYVVNRRTVVDQTTAEVERLRANLEVAGLKDSLQSLLGSPTLPDREDEPLLGLSTLRGQFADNQQWSLDPARPAVIDLTRTTEPSLHCRRHVAHGMFRVDNSDLGDGISMRDRG